MTTCTSEQLKLACWHNRRKFWDHDCFLLWETHSQNLSMPKAALLFLLKRWHLILRWCHLMPATLRARAWYVLTHRHDMMARMQPCLRRLSWSEKEYAGDWQSDHEHGKSHWELDGFPSGRLDPIRRRGPPLEKNSSGDLPGAKSGWWVNYLIGVSPPFFRRWRGGLIGLVG